MKTGKAKWAQLKTIKETIKMGKNYFYLLQVLMNDAVCLIELSDELLQFSSVALRYWDWTSD